MFQIQKQSTKLVNSNKYCIPINKETEQEREKCAVFFDPTCGMINEYRPRGVIQRKLQKNGFNSVITTHQKIPCKREIAGNGFCDKFHDHKHRKFHYHFSQENKSAPGGIPLCRYTQEECWEYNRDPNHKHNFFHVSQITDDKIDYALDWGEYLD